uniref:Uncharacterized protein n=1 Tax=Castor canadensis TaxID=51338 RepID=A0A8C0VZY4_CASCN
LRGGRRSGLERQSMPSPTSATLRVKKIPFHSLSPSLVLYQQPTVVTRAHGQIDWHFYLSFIIFHPQLQT